MKMVCLTSVEFTAPQREGNLPEQISVRQVGKTAECRIKKNKKREKGRGKTKEKNLRCRIAAHSRASILSFGPVHRNLHGKLPQGGDERNASERASGCAGRTPCKQNKVSATTVRKAATQCGAPEIAGYSKAGPKEI